MADQGAAKSPQNIITPPDNNQSTGLKSPTDSPPPPPWAQEGISQPTVEVKPQGSVKETSDQPTSVVTPSPDLNKSNVQAVPPVSESLPSPPPEPVPVSSQPLQTEPPGSSQVNSGAPSTTGGVSGSSPPPSSFSTSSLSSNGGEKIALLKKFLPIIGIIAGVILLLFLVFKLILPRFQSSTSEKETSSKASETKVKTSLTYWGLWEPETVISQVIADYQTANPGVAITYIQQSPKDYRERLQSALAAGTGPDIFRFHNTWVPMLKTELDTAPKGTVNLQEYFPVATQDLQIGTETIGIPLMFDGLALFYNPRLFNEAGESVPTTWEELRKAALEMTVYNDQGKIQTAGVALGTTNNVDHFSDILGLMLLQNGADPGKPTDQLSEDALKFYTIFTTTDNVWDETLPASTYAFAIEKVAMILAPSWRAFDIKEINPELEFKTAPVPQLPGTNVAWASYWVEGVSRRSKNTKAAWEFLKYLSTDEVLTKLYTSEASVRLFGEPYPKKSLSATIETDPVIGAFVKQGDNAKSWYLASRTFDNGINDRIIKYYEDAINMILDGNSTTEALQPLSSGVTQILSQYGASGQ